MQHWSDVLRHLSTSNLFFLLLLTSYFPDLSHYGWVAAAGWAGVEIDEFPTLKAWEERMTNRPGVEKGRHVPDHHGIKDLLKDKEKMEKHAAESRKWVQAGMKQDAAKGQK
jgi:glutathione S-transferase